MLFRNNSHFRVGLMCLIENKKKKLLWVKSGEVIIIPEPINKDDDIHLYRFGFQNIGRFRITPRGDGKWNWIDNNNWNLTRDDKKIEFRVLAVPINIA